MPMQIEAKLAPVPHPLGGGEIVLRSDRTICISIDKIILHCCQLTTTFRVVNLLPQNQNQITRKLVPQTVHSFSITDSPPPSHGNKCDQPRQSVWRQEQQTLRRAIHVRLGCKGSTCQGDCEETAREAGGKCDAFRPTARLRMEKAVNCLEFE